MSGITVRVGRNHTLKVWTETTWGDITPTAARYVQVKPPFGVGRDGAFKSSEILKGGRAKGMPYVEQLDAGGQITYVPHLASLPWLAQFFIGPIGTGTDNLDGTYTYTQKLGALPAGMGVEVWDTVALKGTRLFGGMVSRVTWELVTAAGEPTMTFDLVGQDSAETVSEVAGAVSTAGDLPLLHQLRSTLKVNAVEVGDIQELTLVFDLDVERYWLAVANGTGIPGAVAAGLTGITGTIKAMLHDTEAYSTLADGETEFEVETGLDMGSSRSVNVRLPECKVQRVKKMIQGPKGIAVDFPFEAYLDDGADASPIVLTTINNEASY